MTGDITIGNGTQRASFNRDFFGGSSDFTVIGNGEIGGKANGLASIHESLAEGFNQEDKSRITVNIPRLTVITTKVFDKFMKRNKLYEIALSEESNEKIAQTFQNADFPAEFIGDLMGLIKNVKTPLAIRSSSMLEDAKYSPFAGVYATKMIPNNQFDPNMRFRKLVEAIKFVWASTFFKEAKAYINQIGHSIEEEKMAVIIQEIVGLRYGDRFYPTIAGVARSYNYYPTGKAKSDQGVVDLALGLGKTIVDGGLVWTYSPEYPKANPPYSSTNELLDKSQRTFWAVNMGQNPDYDPLKETEYLIQCDLDKAEEDTTLKYTASTYDGASDRLVPGTGRKGPKVINFPMILSYNDIQINDKIKDMLKICEEKNGCDVEIEFAITLDPKSGTPARIGFLQVRPMVVSDEQIEIDNKLFESPNLVAATNKVMGNGEDHEVQDIVYVLPDKFEAKNTRRIAFELEEINKKLVRENRPYLLIGFGRWGSSDPWLGIPVEWSQINGAKAIVEATLPSMHVDLSQGSHFFHNLSSFKKFYLSISHFSDYKINWDWLASHSPENATENVHHIKLSSPLNILVDGRTGRGIITHDDK